MKVIPTILAAASAALYLGAKAVPGSDQNGPVLVAGTIFVMPSADRPSASSGVAKKVSSALNALASSVLRLSHPRALHDAFNSYFAFRAAHPEQVKRPYFYFVDYGLSNTTPRGYVFDMNALRVIDGPFMVAQGRGSAAAANGVPTRFSNAFGAGTTSLGLYVGQEVYPFTGHTGGHAYRAVGLKLAGVSTGFNDNARARGVVAHGAPYVTETRAGRSEGCPA